MWRFFWILVILILSVWLGVKVAEDPGVAYFSYRQWSMEMPLWFAMLALLIIFLLIHLFIRFFDSIDFTLYRLRNWQRLRRKYKSYSKTNRGLIELIEGRWKSAEYYLQAGVSQSDAPLINYLAASKAAEEQGAFDRRDAYLRKAHTVAPQAEIAIGITQVQLQLEQGQLEQALACLRHIRTLSPKHELILKLLKKIYLRLGDWTDLLKLMPSLRKIKSLSTEELDDLERTAYLELLRSVAAKQDNLYSLESTWRTIPKKYQRDPLLIHCYVEQLLLSPDKIDKVEDLINFTLKKSWDTDLVQLYGLLETREPKKQLSHAENWLKIHANQPVLLLALGRISIRCLLWGKARSYFEESLKIDPAPETYLEYAKLLERLGETENALANYRAGLLANVEKRRGI